MERKIAWATIGLIGAIVVAFPILAVMGQITHLTMYIRAAIVLPVVFIWALYILRKPKVGQNATSNNN